jgi:hypothetical protein
MAYIAKNPSGYAIVGNGQCVAYVQEASGAPVTANWVQGVKVRGNSGLATGTAIATFDADGRYGNHTDGSSHAAIYISQDTTGIWVWDQWVGQPVHKRHIRFQGGALNTKKVNDGDAYYVID